MVDWNDSNGRFRCFRRILACAAQYLFQILTLLLSKYVNLFRIARLRMPPKLPEVVLLLPLAVVLMLASSFTLLSGTWATTGTTSPTNSL